MSIKTSALRQGDRLRLVDFGETPLAYRRRLLALGLTRGMEVSVVRVAPLGCPVQLDIRGTLIALRQHEAMAMRWERV